VSPYRDPPKPNGQATTPPGEEWVLAVVLVVVGFVRIGVALATHEALATEVTLAALLGALGCLLLARLAHRA
jgi:hypothetical protein